MNEKLENDLGFIKISNLSVFKELYESENNFKNETLEKKANELISNYKCFVSNYDAKSLWEKKKIIAAQKSNKAAKNRNKPRIILIDFSDEMKCKKEFISYLNKLTDINKEIIYNKISAFIKELNITILNSLFEVLLNFIKISSNNIYIDVLFLFDMEYIINNINNYFEIFINNKHWLPTEIIMENKLLFNNDNYDKYCLYVKLKKHSLSIIKALMIIIKKLDNYEHKARILLNEIYKDFN